MVLFRRVQDFFVDLYLWLCGGSLYRDGGAPGPDGAPRNKAMQFPALVLLTVPFYVVAWFVEPFISKYFRIVLLAYILGVLFFVASVDMRARARGVPRT